MTFLPVKPGGWGLEERLTSAQMNALQEQNTHAIDGVDGGSYTLGGDIVLGGTGKLEIDNELLIANGAELTVANGGDVNLANGADLNVASGAEIAVANGGDINVASGGEVNVAAGGAINILSGPGISVKSGARIELLSGADVDCNSGSEISVEAGAHIDVAGEINIQSGGKLDVESGGDINLASGGDINVASGSNINVLGEINIQSLGQIDIEDGGDINVASNGSINVASGGQILIGGGEIQIQSGASKLRLISAPVVPFRLTMLGIPSDPAGFQPHFPASWIQNDVINDQEIMFPLNMLPGERIETLRVRLTGAGGAGHSGISMTLPSARLVSVDQEGVTTTHATASDPSVSQVAYDANHDISFSAGLPLTVPSDPLYVRVTGEKGTDAIANTTELISIRGTTTPFLFRGTTEVH